MLVCLQGEDSSGCRCGSLCWLRQNAETGAPWLSEHGHVITGGCSTSVKLCPEDGVAPWGHCPLPTHEDCS